MMKHSTPHWWRFRMNRESTLSGPVSQSERVCPLVSPVTYPPVFEGLTMAQSHAGRES